MRLKNIPNAIKSPARVRIVAHLPTDMRTEFEHECTRRGISMTAGVIGAIEFWLLNVSPELRQPKEGENG